MIRKFETDDLVEVMEIWLESNIKAHNFIDESYWKENYEMVKEMLPQATLYVYEEHGTIQGFVGLMDHYIPGIFVQNECQSRGIGKSLLDYIKARYPSLSLKVYKNNIGAVNFYQREKFVIREEKIDENTKEIEYVMNWEKQSIEK
ncbi:putative acetyltransferase [Natranaerovirga hydrolytica]|uniref:Putative acetyltransferase n=1 Tax=Natranaerovirga hydrolytica TaxID=680378 RepID=A0A4V2Q070_9FIRM|nr:N-acetyltransferase [Natranaerovirga hydrolytica]TCK92571.1 putative acetyltransferase [Natranaerovirga hydrolytica]